MFNTINMFIAFFKKIAIKFIKYLFVLLSFEAI